MVGLAKIKTLNRSIHRNLDEERKSLDIKKTELEKLQLEYENLIYKKNYLIREIHQCQDISTPNLLQIEEERGRTIGTLQYHENLFPEIHQKALEELEEEKQLRLEMEKHYQGLQTIYASRLDDLEKKKKFLDDFPKRIEKIRASTKELDSELESFINPPQVPDNITPGEEGSLATGEEGEILDEANIENAEKKTAPVDETTAMEVQ